MEKALFVRAEWDENAEVWVATSDDVPKLVAEADTAEALLTKLRTLLPELLEANGYPNSDDVSFELFSRCSDYVRYEPKRIGYSLKAIPNYGYRL
jgi:hypothetical protein